MSRVESGLANQETAVKKLSIGIIVLALLGASPADAGDAAMPTTAPAVPAYDWTGAYVGFHFGYGGGSLGSGTHPILDKGVIFPPTITGLVGGYQAGWNVQLSNRLVLGVEADVTFTSSIDRGATDSAARTTRSTACSSSISSGRPV